MLSPQTRRMDKMTEAPVPGYIYRTSAPSCLIVPPGFVPDKVKPFTGMLNKVAGWAFKRTARSPSARSRPVSRSTR